MNVFTRLEEPADLGRLLARWGRVGLVAGLAWLALMGGWLHWAPIAGAVVGYGQVKVDRDRQTVTHRDGGIVAQVLVREGQEVRQGQTLVVLEDARVDSTADLVLVQIDAERLREARLQAEAAVAPAWGPQSSARLAPAVRRAPDAAAREVAAFEARRRSFEGQLEAARSQIADTDKEIQAHQRNRQASMEGARLMREEVASNEELLKENFVNRTRVISLKRNLAEYESRLESIDADLAKARQRRTELEGRLSTLRLSYVQAATDELRETTARLTDLEARAKAWKDTTGRQTIVAPVAGRLVGLKVNTVGSAIGPREPIVDVVPSGVPLLVEARLAPDAVSELRVGQQAGIRLLGHARRNLGLVDGKIVNVSGDTISDARSGQTYFTVLIQPDPESLAQLDPASVSPGMAAEVFVTVSDRTALSFLLDPLVAGMRRGFREF